MAIQAILDLRKTLANVPGITEEYIEKTVAETEKQLREPAMKRINDELIKAANKLLETKKFADDVALLHGARFGVVVEIDKDGKAKVSARTAIKKRSKRSTSGTSNGKRPRPVYNGTEYVSGKAMCDELGIDVGKGSWRVAWAKAVKDGDVNDDLLTERVPGEETETETETTK